MVTAYEFRTLTSHDEMQEGYTLQRDPKNPRIAIIRTSDRLTFKSCRRRWGWSSHLRHNLGPKQNAAPLWFGSGMHFALEDFHGYNRFGRPNEAFKAFVKATKEHNASALPEEWPELAVLGEDMLNYYLDVWLVESDRDPLQTVWVDGKPQVEVNFRFKIPFDQTLLESYGYDEVYYSGTIDRVCVDPETGLYWLLDYKSAKSIQTLHYQTDPQVSAYMWAAPYIYPDATIGGFIYQQHLKSVPKPGRVLQKPAGAVSTAANQSTDWFMYRNTLKKQYGDDSTKWPPENLLYLKNLKALENDHDNPFVRRDKIYRNPAQAEAQGAIIMMEVEDMLNPRLPLYPNQTRDCASFCPFLSPCVSLDAGMDWKHELDVLMVPRAASYDPWRKKIKWPEAKNSGFESFDWENV